MYRVVLLTAFRKHQHGSVASHAAAQFLAAWDVRAAL
jgi:hypothetical protein